MAAAQKTYLLIDGENLDATLGGSILHRKPAPEERPRWDRLLLYMQQRWGQEVTGLFFIAVTGELPHAFVQALQAIGYAPILLSGEPDQKVVDIGIQKTLTALADRPGDVVLASHDGDFVPFLEPLAGTRRTAVAGFKEFVSSGYRPLVEVGLEIIDLERDMGAFNVKLPRIRIIPVAEFDPLEFL
jgi:putative heme uptake system protein